MSAFLYALGRWCFRHAARVVLGWVGLLLVCGLVAVSLMEQFDNSFEMPGTESQAALDQLEMTFPEMAGATATMVVIPGDPGTMDTTGVEEAIEESVSRISELDFVESAQSPYLDLIDGLISPDRDAGLVNIVLAESLTDFTDDHKHQLQAEALALEQDLPGSTVRMGGQAFNAEIPTVGATEGVGVVVALVVLCITMGSLIAASMPVINALIGVAISMGLILAATGLTTINSTTPLLALMLGLAVGMDYALFILARHREQLGEGMEVGESIARAVATSGSAVVFAGVTNFIALMGLALAGIPFLTVMGVAASGAIAVAVAISLTLIPALAGLVGERLRPRTARTHPARAPGSERHPGLDGHPGSDGSTGQDRGSDTSRMQQVAHGTGGGAAGWWVRVTTARPLVTVVIVLVGLGALALPARDMHLALPNAGQNPPESSSRQAYDLTAAHFGPGHNGPLVVTVDILSSDDPLGLMADLTEEIEAMEGVDMVPIAVPNRGADTGIIQIFPTTAPDDPATEELVRALRQAQPRWEADHGAATAVTGYTAIAIDVSTQLGRALIPFGVFVVGLTLVLLMMVFRSVWVPIKAALGFLLSTAAAFGVTELVFGRGVGAQLLNVEILGPVISFLPIVTMAILFGMSMDYELFLVSRMREDHAAGRPAGQAVHTGFVGSSLVVVAAAIIMVAVFAAFVPDSDRGTLQPIALALTVGVAVDAFIVRMTLVPAIMAMLGERAWWLPRALDRALPVLDVEGAAISEQLRLRNWPAAEKDYAVYAEDLVAGDQDHLLHAPVTLALTPGQRLLVVGEPSHRSALLLSLAGRMPLARGRARITGRLWHHAHAIRRAVALVDGLYDTDVAPRLEELRTARAGRIGLIILDNVDRITDDCARRAVQKLLQDTDRTVLLGARSTASVEGIAVTDVLSVQPHPQHRRTMEQHRHPEPVGPPEPVETHHGLDLVLGVDPPVSTPPVSTP